MASDNFVYSDFASRVGTQNQNYVEGFAASENAVNVNSSVGDDVGDSVVRTITDTDVDAVIVRIAFNQIYRVDNGLKATSIGYAIDVQSDGGGYVEKVNTTVSGKCTSTYERSHRIELTGSAPWDIKLRRVSGVNDSTNNVRLMTFAGYTEIIDAKLRYPLTALVGLRFEASQFQAIPTRAYDIKGVKVQIPQNATVNTDGSLSYSGTWDGTFKVAWCADPAWILRDLLLSSRYGLGRFVANAQVDKWTLYEISKYCNASVPDGEGGNEPRFLCNVYLQSREEAYNVVQDFCSCFRGMAYWSAGQIAFTQDSPKDAAALFSNSNVIEGIFNYEGSSLKARHTVTLVTWNDPDNAYQQRVEYVSDEAAISKYGIIEVRMAAFGCTSRGQANRLGRWLLYSEQQETTTCTFTVGLDGAIVRPGQIIKVADQMRAGARKGGRIASATTTELTLDQSFAVDEGDTVSVVMPDGRVEQREIDDGDFDAKTITVKTAFSTTPETQSIFVVETSTVEAQTFRVISVTEDGENYKITALEHNRQQIRPFIEDGLALQPRDITALNQKPGAPSGINVDERLVESGNRVTTEIEISWGNVDGATAYQVSFKTANNLSFFTVGDTPYNNLTFLTDETGNFTFRVVAISPLGKRSNPAELTQNIAGSTAAPEAVSGFSMIPVNGQARLTWAQSTELDVRVGGYVRVRHSPDLSGVTWAKSTSISQDLAGSATEAYADLKTGTYLAKFVDSGGRESLTASLIEFTKPDLEDLVNVDSQQEDPTFPGTKTNLIVDTDLQELGLSFDGGETNSAGDFLAEDGTYILCEDGSKLVLQGDATLNTSGTYLFENNPITLSDVFSIKLESTVRARQFYFYGDRIDDVTSFDAISDFDGEAPSGADVELYIRTTEDDPAGSPTWSSWRLFNNAEFKARAYEVKAEFSTEANTEQIAVDQLRIDSNMPSRTTRGTGTSSASADVSITYTNKFAATPVIGITAFNMATGDYYTASNSSATGFDISFYNSGGTRVVRNFDWTATGYGKG
jgi:predicted phage tail protein